jgi:hypothetical protein
MKNKIKLLAILAASVALVGCGTTEQYKMYADTQKSIAQANAMAETARYAALAEIAKTGDSGARVAAVMSINFGSQGGNSPRVQQVAPPKTFGETALQWTSVLLPSVTNLYGISANRQIAITQSNNAAATAASTNSAMVNIANGGAAAATSIANGSATAVTAIATEGFKAASPTITVGGNYNTGSNSGNSGRIAGGGIVDNTATPTVVVQPEPVVVNQPAPVVVTNTTNTSTPVIVTQPEPVIVTQPEPVIVTQPEPVIVTQPEPVIVTNTTTVP